MMKRFLKKIFDVFRIRALCQVSLSPGYFDGHNTAVTAETEPLTRFGKEGGIEHAMPPVAAGTAFRELVPVSVRALEQ
jgi:hypothetical protein